MPNNQVSLFCLFFKKKQSSGFVPHRPSVCLLMGLKPSHIIQELLAFVCCELCDIKPGFPFPCVCVSVLCLSQKKKKKNYAKQSATLFNLLGPLAEGLGGREGGGGGMIPLTFQNSSFVYF